MGGILVVNFPGEIPAEGGVGAAAEREQMGGQLTLFPDWEFGCGLFDFGEAHADQRMRGRTEKSRWQLLHAPK